MAAAGAPGRLVAFLSFASSLARALAMAFLLAFVDFFAGVAEAFDDAAGLAAAAVCASAETPSSAHKRTRMNFLMP